jgi:hypothetical protein
LRAQGSEGDQDVSSNLRRAVSEKIFAAMLALPKRRTKPVAIISDAVDRFQRSFKESVLIDELIRKEKVATTSIGRE